MCVICCTFAAGFQQIHDKMVNGDFLGQLISIGVAFSWTATAMLSEYGSKRMGNLTLNVLRMSMALLCSAVLFLVVTGRPWPAGGGEACWWLFLSGIVGYVIGDYCLFQCYIIIGSRYGQLFMTLAPLAAALMAWLMLGQKMSPTSILAMFVTLAGIGISVLGREGRQESKPRVRLMLPRAGVLYAIGAAMCQGVGLVLSKFGMDHYDGSQLPAWLLPFGSNFFRCIAGLAGFGILLYWRDGLAPLRHALHDRRGMCIASATTVFGPFVGVSFSLMAVQYTNAGVASTLMALTPVIIILPSRLIFHERITWRAVIGAVVSVMGVSLFFLL